MKVIDYSKKINNLLYLVFYYKEVHASLMISFLYMDGNSIQEVLGKLKNYPILL